MVIEAVSDLAGNAKEMIRFVDEEVEMNTITSLR